MHIAIFFFFFSLSLLLHGSLNVVVRSAALRLAGVIPHCSPWWHGPHDPRAVALQRDNRLTEQGYHLFVDIPVG